MKLLRGLACLALFCGDVHVRAQDLSDCWGRQGACTVQALGVRKVVESESLKVSLASGSILERRKDEWVQLVGGSFYIETSRPTVFNTPYARFECESECKALVDRKLNEVTIKNLSGRWLIHRTGESQRYVLAPGLQLLIGEVEANGNASMEFPQSLPWLATAKQWAELYPGPIKSFKEELVDFRPVWKGAVEAVSRLHQETASRTIATYEAGQADERARRKARESEDESLRRLFRQKNNIGQ